MSLLDDWSFRSRQHPVYPSALPKRRGRKMLVAARAAKHHAQRLPVKMDNKVDSEEEQGR